MSKQVDQRVVEMRFDNENFERNVKSTMSTLDKLKQSLRFDGAAKGLDNIEKSVKNVDMNPLSKAVETINIKFSALEVIGITALQNITNSAINVGKQLVRSLSFDQITAGYSKYEQETSNVQTLMNSTGKSVDEVNGYLEKLMWFSDETSYGFTDMTSALSSMVSAGGNIDKLIPMIEGMANATAYAGKGAAEFSRVIYNLNQSYGQGYLSLMDWKSVEQAGAGSKQLKQLFIDTAKELGTLTKAGELADGTLVSVSNFSQTLNKQWATSDVMEKTFTKFANYATAVQKLSAETGMSTSEAMDTLKGKYDEVAVKAFEAAQKAKSFSEAVDATKDAASSEWKKIFKAVVGDYDEATNLWTDVTNDLWDIFVGPLTEAREAVQDAMGSNWDKVSKQISNAGIPIESFKNKAVELGKKYGVVTDKMIKDSGSFEASLKSGWLNGKIVSEAMGSFTKTYNETASKFNDFQKKVREIINGDFGNGEARVKALTKAGYDYNTMQALVNKVWERNNYTWKDTNITMSDLTEVMGKLSNKELENIGFTKEQIAQISKLRTEAEKTGTPFNDLINSMSKPSGRELLSDTISNVLNGIKGVVTAIGEVTGSITSSGIYKFIETLNTASKKLILISDYAKDGTAILNENGKKLVRTFKGVHAVFSLIGSIIKGTLKVAFNILSILFGNINGNVLDVTASIGDMLVKFTDWIRSNETINKVLDITTSILYKVASAIRTVIGKIVDLIKQFKNSEIGAAIISAISKALSFLIEMLGKAFTKLKSIDFAKYFEMIWNWLVKIYEEVRKNEIVNAIIETMKKAVDGLKTSVSGLWKSITDIINGKKTITSFFEDLWKSILSIFDNNGQKDTKSVGGNIIQGLINGIFKFSSFLFDIIKTVITKIITLTQEILGIHSPSLVFFEIGKNIILGLLNGILDTLLGVSSTVFTAIHDLIKIITDNINVGKMAAVLSVVAIAYVVKRLIDVADKCATSFVNLSSILKSASGVFDGIRASIDTLTKSLKREINFSSVLILASAVSILAFSVYELSKIDITKMWSAVGAVTTLMLVLVAVATLLSSNLINVDANKIASFQSLISVIISFTAVLYAMTGLIAIISSMDSNGVAIAIKALSSMIAMISVLTLLAVGISNKDLNDSIKILAELSGIMMLLGVALSVVSRIPQNNLGPAIKAMGALLVAETVLVAIMHLIKNEDLTKASLSMLELSGVFLVLGATMRLMATMDSTQIGVAIAGLGALVIAIGLLITITRIAPEKKLQEVTNALFKIAGCMGILTIVMKVLSSITLEGMETAIVGLSVLVIAVGLLVTITRIAPEKKLQEVSNALLKIAGCMGILAVVMKLLSNMEPRKLGVAISGLGVLVIAIGLLITITRIAPEKKLQEVTNALLKIAGCMGILAVVMKIMATINYDELGHAAVGLAMLVGVIAILLLIVRISPDKQVVAVQKLMLSIAVCAAILSGVSVVLGMIPFDILIKGVAMMAVILAALSLVVGQAKGLTAATIAPLIMIMLMIAELTAAVIIIGKQPMKSVIASAASLAGLLLVCALVIAICKKIASDSPKDALIGIGALTAMFVPLMAFALVLNTMSDVQNGIQNAIALGALLVASSIVLYILQNTVEQGTIKAAYEGAIALLAMAIPLMAYVGVLYTAGGIQNGIQNAIALAGLLIVSSIVLAILKYIVDGNFAESAVQGIVGLLGMAAVMMVLVEVLKQANDVQNSIANAIALATLIMALSLALVPLAAIGEFAGFGAIISGVGGLIVALLMFGVVAGVLGWLMTTFPSISEFVNSGVDLLCQLSAGIGKVIGSFVSGIATGLMEILPNLADSLTSFATKITPFLDKMRTVDGEVVKGAGYLAATVIAISGSGFIKGVLDFLTIGDPIDKFGAALIKLGPYIAKFAESVANVDGLNIKNCAEAGLYLSQLVKNLPTSGGIMESIFGKPEDMETFGSQMKKFGESLIGFQTATEGIKIDIVRNAVEAGKLVIDMAKEIPNSGGWLGEIMGENDMDKFAPQMVKFGECLAEFQEKVTNVSQDVVNNGVEAGKKVITMAKDIPNSGGLIGQIFGENNMDDFGEKLVSFGGSLKTFADKVDGIKIEAVTAAATAGQELAKINEYIPNIGGIAGFLAGNKSMAVFGTQIESFGGSLKSFSDEVKNIVAADVAKGVAAGKELAELQSILPKMGGLISLFSGNKGLDTFGDQLASYGQSLATYYDKVKGINVKTFSDTNKEIKYLVDVAKNVESIDLDSVSGFADTLASMAEDGVKAFVDKFKNSAQDAKDAINSFVKSSYDAAGSESNKTGFTKSAKALIKALVSGLNQNGDVITSIKTTCTKMLDAIKSRNLEFTSVGSSLINNFKSGMKSVNMNDISSIGTKIANALQKSYNDMYNAGSYLVSGFSRGINGTDYLAINSASDLAYSVVSSIKKALNIHSPSKVTEELGSYAGIGFVNALIRYAKYASDAGYNLGESAKDGLNNAIDAIQDYIDGNISDQPTIKPVLDLTNLENGARRINGILSTDQAYSIGSDGVLGIQNGMGNIVINMEVHGAPGQDVTQLADIVADRINNSIQRRNNVWR